MSLLNCAILCEEVEETKDNCLDLFSICYPSNCQTLVMTSSVKQVVKISGSLTVSF